MPTDQKLKNSFNILKLYINTSILKLLTNVVIKKIKKLFYIPYSEYLGTKVLIFKSHTCSSLQK